MNDIDRLDKWFDFIEHNFIKIWILYGLAVVVFWIAVIVFAVTLWTAIL